MEASFTSSGEMMGDDKDGIEESILFLVDCSSKNIFESEAGTIGATETETAVAAFCRLSWF